MFLRMDEETYEICISSIPNRICFDLYLFVLLFHNRRFTFLPIFSRFTLFRYFVENVSSNLDPWNMCARARSRVAWGRMRVYVNAYLIRRSGSFVCMSYLYRITTTLPIRRAINVPATQAEMVNSIAFIGPAFRSTFGIR